MKKNAQWSVFGLVVIFGVAGCKNNNLFGDLHKEGSGDAPSLVADGQAALESSNFAKADSYFSQALEKEPRNSDALYGQAAAQMGLSGLSLGQLISNLTQGNSSAGAPGLHGAISQSTLGLAGGGQDDPKSLLFGINVPALDDALNVVIVNLEKIRMGMSDGKIASDSPSLLINLGLARLLKAATKPLRLHFVDLQENSGIYTASLLVAPSTNGFCTAVGTSIRNVAWGYLNLRDAALKLNLVSGSTLSDIQKDVDDLYAEYKDVVGSDCTGSIPATRGDAGVPSAPTDGTD